MKFKFDVEGLKELDEALVGLAEEFSPRNARNVLGNTLKDAGKPIAQAGEANAPRLSGKLAISYTVGTKLSRRQKSKNVKKSQIERYVGPTPHAKSVQTEFGNAHQAAHPHLRPAFDSTWRQSLGIIVVRVRERVEETRKRLARKAERLAAKMNTGL